MNFKRLAAVTVPVLAFSAWGLWPSTYAPVPVVVAKQAVAPATVQEPEPEVDDEDTSPAPAVDLALVLEQKSVVAEFSGNGRDKFVVRLTNKNATPIRVGISLGQLFDSATAAPVIVAETAAIDVPAGKTRERQVRVAALRSTGKIGPATYRISYITMPKLEPLLRQVHQHPEITQPSLQTAVLALAENLPVSAVAKFSPAAGNLPSRFNTDAFRVQTFELVGALVLLREIGTRESSLAMTVDPQLKIEAMIDPAARPLAMRYYGIAMESEWEFWRRELLQGEPSTRHYALYGIARFYPDVALQMLPRWALETRTNPVYRLSAVQALADTQRPEALGILRGLATQLAAHQELAKAASGAADYLEYQLAQNAAIRDAVAFRTARKSSGDLAVARN